MMQDLVVKVDSASVISQIKELRQKLHYYNNIRILIRGIYNHMPEPYKTQVLNEWDAANTKEKYE